MALPLALDPDLVSIAGVVVRHAVDQSHLAGMSDDDKQAVVERGVARIIAAGGFVRDGALFFPRSATDTT